jgi:predicted AAA+ superfamily ATPase
MIPEELIEVSDLAIERASRRFVRYMENEIPWENQLIGIKGARGVGKTTLILQHLQKLNYTYPLGFYVSLDDLFFTQRTLLETAAYFHRNGGKILVLDEVHKYPNWAQEIKNIYDRYPQLQVVFTGSSIIDITRQVGDLSRRALLFTMPGLSYREYLILEYELEMPRLSLDQILEGNIQKLFPKDFRPLQYFQEYLERGYYPFTSDDTLHYYQRLRQLSRQIVEYDMAEMRGFDIRHARKMNTLLYIIAQQVPFTPNLTKLAEKSGIHRNSVTNYLYYLEEARLLLLLQAPGMGVGLLQKPEKVFLENPNLAYALAASKPEIGTIRESFFFNQLHVNHRINHSKKGDFLVDDTYIFEIGGKNKNNHQISDTENAFVVSDSVEWGYRGNVPLWAFGMMY